MQLATHATSRHAELTTSKVPLVGSSILLPDDCSAIRELSRDRQHCGFSISFITGGHENSRGCERWQPADFHPYFVRAQITIIELDPLPLRATATDHK